MSRIILFFVKNLSSYFLSPKVEYRFNISKYIIIKLLSLHYQCRKVFFKRREERPKEIGKVPLFLCQKMVSERLSRQKHAKNNSKSPLRTL
jgi:hypothetical protein